MCATYAFPFPLMNVYVPTSHLLRFDFLSAHRLSEIHGKAHTYSRISVAYKEAGNDA